MSTAVGEIPFVNLERQLAGMRGELLAAFEEVVDSQAFINGPFLRQFESEFLKAIDANFGSGCANGTAALALGLEALGVGPGDEVITASHTFAATGEAIRHVGATPVFVDISPESYTILPQAVEAAITSRTRALIAVHIYGTPCMMDDIARIADAFELYLIEDTAQAHLARWRNRFAGTLGDAGAFSFFPGKNLGAFGDAGFVVASDETVADRIRRLLDHGRSSKYVHELVGYNLRMDGLQAALLSVKLKYLAAWTQRRRELAKRYDAVLTAEGFKVIQPPAHAEPVYHLYVAEVSNRAEVVKQLAEVGIKCGVHYPVPLHRQPAFAEFAGDEPLPVTERIVERIISLPICGELTDEEQDYVCQRFLTVARP